MSKRIEWIDIVKFICIFCVINIHLSCNTTTLYNFYFTFYLAGFFFCAGYCYKPLKSFKELIIKKGRQLLLPWFIYSNVNILISQVGSIKEHKDLLTELFRNFLQVRNYDERLWFLVSLFTAFIPFYFLVKYIEKKENNINKAIIIAILLFFIKKAYSYYMPIDIFVWESNKLPWHIDYIPTALLSMVLGYCLKIKYEKSFDKTNTLANRILFTVFFLLVIVVKDVFQYRNFVSYALYDFIGHVSGLIFVVMWSKCIKTNKFISFVGSNTLIYFCIHNKFATVIEYLFMTKLASIYSLLTSTVLLSSITSILLTLVIIVVLIPFVVLINKYLPWTIGKRKENV